MVRLKVLRKKGIWHIQFIRAVWKKIKIVNCNVLEYYGRKEYGTYIHCRLSLCLGLMERERQTFHQMSGCSLVNFSSGHCLWFMSKDNIQRQRQRQHTNKKTKTFHQMPGRPLDNSFSGHFLWYMYRDTIKTNNKDIFRFSLQLEIKNNILVLPTVIAIFSSYTTIQVLVSLS